MPFGSARSGWAASWLDRSSVVLPLIVPSVAVVRLALSVPLAPPATFSAPVTVNGLVVLPTLPSSASEYEPDGAALPTATVPPSATPACVWPRLTNAGTLTVAVL